MKRPVCRAWTTKTTLTFSSSGVWPFSWQKMSEGTNWPWAKPPRNRKFCFSYILFLGFLGYPESMSTSSVRLGALLEAFQILKPTPSKCWYMFHLYPKKPVVKRRNLLKPAKYLQMWMRRVAFCWGANRTLF